MSVHNRTKKLDEHEDRWTYVRSATCPCRPCFRPRDYRYYNSHGEWVTQIECVTRQSGGCPLPPPKPKHVSADENLFCERCGARLSAFSGNEQHTSTRQEEVPD